MVTHESLIPNPDGVIWLDFAAIAGTTKPPCNVIKVEDTKQVTKRRSGKFRRRIHEDETEKSEDCVALLSTPTAAYIAAANTPTEKVCTRELIVVANMSSDKMSPATQTPTRKITNSYAQTNRKRRRKY